jgi:hypothetical protein
MESMSHYSRSLSLSTREYAIPAMVDRIQILRPTALEVEILVPSSQNLSTVTERYDFWHRNTEFLGLIKECRSTKPLLLSWECRIPALDYKVGVSKATVTGMGTSDLSSEE